MHLLVRQIHLSVFVESFERKHGLICNDGLVSHLQMSIVVFDRWRQHLLIFLFSLRYSLMLCFVAAFHVLEKHDLLAELLGLEADLFEQIMMARQFWWLLSLLSKS